MPAKRKNIGDSVRGITRQALERGKLDRAAVRRGAASEGMNATLASGAMVARVASGMLAGIADTLTQKRPRRPR